MQHEMFGAMAQPQYKEYIKDIRDSGVHLLEIINDILDLSKIEAGKFELQPLENFKLPDAVESPACAWCATAPAPTRFS